MKKWLLTPMLAILTGCVSYYYPYGEPQEGVRYVPADEYVENVYYEDEPYYEDEVVDRYDYSDIYVSSPYYPWWSIDYFYLGSHHHHNGFSIGFNYGSPWYWGSYNSYYDPFYPSYRYSPWSVHYSPFRFSAWYSPFYDRPYRHFGGNHYFWRNRYDRHHGSRHRDRDRHAGNNRRRHDDNRSTLAPGRRHDGIRGEDRYANDDRDRNERRRRGEDGPVGSGRNPRRGGPGTDGLQRHTTVAGGASDGQRGMEIRNRQDRKPKPSRMEPVTGYRPGSDKPVVKLSPSGNTKGSSGKSRGSANPATEKAAAAYSKGEQYRRPAAGAAKPSSSRTRNSNSTPVARGITSSRSGASTVRSPVNRKPQGTRTQPSRPTVSSPGQRSPVVSYRPPKADKRAGRASNTRKPVASIRSKPSRRTPAKSVPSGPSVVTQPRAPSVKYRTQPTPRSAPARKPQSQPGYSAPSRQQSRPASPPPRPAVKSSKPQRAKASARPENRKGSRRGSGRKER